MVKMTMATIETNQKSLDCPVCGITVTDGRTTCQQCSTDLGLLLLVDNLAPAHYNLGLRLAHEGKTDRAIEQLLTVLSFEPTHTEALIVLGKLHAQQGHYDRAITYWQRALKVDPSNLKAQVGIRKVRVLRGQKDRPHWRRWILVAVATVLMASLIAVSAFWAGHNLASADQPTEEIMSAKPATPPSEAPSPTATPMLAAPVQTTLQADEALAQLGLTVRQDGRVIYLSGVVPKPNLKEQAVFLAKEVSGVEAVDSSGIDIVPLPLIEAVQADFQANPEFVSLEVKQIGHNIRLSGDVPTSELKDRAVKIARGVEGVELVDSSDLTVVSPDLTKLVQDALTHKPQLAEVNVIEQNGSTIRLVGMVNGSEMKNLAEELAGAVEGVEFVDSRELVITLPPLAENVRQALGNDPSTANFEIEVEQVGQGIRLKGTVPTLDTKIAVQSVTRDVAGVELLDASGILIEPSFIEYVIQVGDSLAAIARKFYGDETKWPFIYQANRPLVTRPGQLQTGSRLIIPQDVR